MSHLTIRRFTLEDIKAIAKCYQKVFQAEPWFEWKTCSRCKKKWGIEQITELEAVHYMHCGIPVVDFWPLDQVEAEIRTDAQKRHWSCWLALDSGKIVGFCWGYALALPELESKLEIQCASAIVQCFGEQTYVAYQNELGLLPEYRGQHHASELFRARLHDFLDAGLTIGVVRTKTLPPSVTHTWYTTKLGYQVVQQYQDTDGRVILASNLKRISREYLKTA